MFLDLTQSPSSQLLSQQQVFCWGQCVISLVLSCPSNDLKWRTSVTAWLQLNFFKQRIVHPQVLRVDQPKRRGLNPSWLLTFMQIVSSQPLSLLYVSWASLEGGMFVSPEVLTPVRGFSVRIFFYPFGPFFVFWPPLSYSNYLTLPPKEMGGPVLWEQGCRGLSGCFLLIWDEEGHWASLFASLKPQSAYSGVCLRENDIFHGRVQFYISLLNWHCMLQLVDLGRDRTGQTIDNTWSNHKQHQYGDSQGLVGALANSKFSLDRRRIP